MTKNTLINLRDYGCKIQAEGQKQFTDTDLANQFQVERFKTTVLRKANMIDCSLSATRIPHASLS